MSAVQNLAPGVDTTLLSRHLTVVMSEVLVATGPAHSILFPPTVSLIHFFNFFVGAILGHYVGIGCRFVCGHLMVVNEKDCVGSAVGVGIISLRAFAEFVAHHLGPFCSLRIISELLVACLSSCVDVDGVTVLGHFKEGRICVGLENVFQLVGQ